MQVALATLVEALGGALHGDPSTQVSRIAPLSVASSDAISFLSSPRLAAQLTSSRAGCLIVAPSMVPSARARGGLHEAAVIEASDPYLYYARLSQWWAKNLRAPVVAGIHQSAVVHPDALVDRTASVGACAVIERGARIAAHAVVGPHSFVGANASVGEDTHLVGKVTLARDCVMGARCIVHPGAVIGADGFGFAPEPMQSPSMSPQGMRWVKIEQLGAVVVGDDVEIGANTCIDRGALGNTVIEDGVKLDNLIQIGHNVRIGKHTAIAGNAGVAGSTVIGAHCMIAGAANIIGHLVIADHVTVSVATTITRSIRKPGVYSGVYPFDDNADWEKNAASLKQLNTLRMRVKAIEAKLGVAKHSSDQGEQQP